MKLSIITINRNNAAGLKKTIQSVASQRYTDFEYIVIDGASNDDSVDVIKMYRDTITYWVSEPDTGIYNAMNKGIGKAQGEYCLFLNSGDWLIDDRTLARLFDEIANSDEAGIYYTDCPATNHTFFQPPRYLDINYLVIHNLNHQNSIIKRALFLKHGVYREEFKIAADYEFWLREFWTYKTKFLYIKTNIAVYDSCGISSTSNFDAELEYAIRRVFGEMSESLIKLRRYSKSAYGEIIETYGPSKLIEFMLKSYRYSMKIITKLFKKETIKK